ncbi:MAG: acyl-CoA dehydrogenase family protein [Candidatus Hadarchaeales archaeon]
MDFELTEDQRMFKDTLREFLNKHFPESYVNKRDREGPLTRQEAVEIMKKFKSIGIGLDPENIRSMMDPMIFCLFAEEVGRVWPSLLPLFGMGAIPALFAPFADEDVKDRILRRMERCEFIGCFAETEPEAGCDTSNLKTTAKLEGDHYVINGRKTWISNAPIADTAWVGAKSSETGAETFFLVEKEVSGWETNELHKIGWKASPTGEMFFDNCKVPQNNEMMVLVQRAFEQGGLPVSEGYMKLLTSVSPVTAMLTMPRAGMCLMSVGIAEAAFEKAVEYAKERVQFGKPIGKFQLIQEMLYKMNVLIETARLLGYKAVHAIMKGDPDARRLSAMAKVYGGEASVKVTYMAMQIFGGNGLSDEMPLERYFRDARMQTVPDGTSEIMKLITGYSILGKGFSAYA